jgi:HK97 family phage major capsid protein
MNSIELIDKKEQL